MKILKQREDKFEVEFERVVKTTREYSLEELEKNIERITKDINALTAEKSKYEEILNLINKK